MENKQGVLIVDYGDLLDIQEMLLNGTDLASCIESLFIVSGQEPTWISDVQLSAEPSENQRELAEKILQAIEDFIKSKKEQ